MKEYSIEIRMTIDLTNSSRYGYQVQNNHHKQYYSIESNLQTYSLEFQ